MAEALYPYSREEVKREGELAQWKRSHQANVKCAWDIKNLIASHTQEGRLEPGCVRAALDTWGFPRVQIVLSNTLRCANAQDLAPDALHWARAAYVPHEKSNGEFKIQADCQRRCDFVVFRRTGYVEKWRVMVYSLCIIILAVFVRQA